MSEKYTSKSTSNQSAIVNDLILSQNTLTRRIIRPQLIDNPKNIEASVKISILHQKAISKDQFQDIESAPLTQYKAGEIGKLNLDSAETKKLYDELTNLYAIYNTKGVPNGNKSIVVGFDNEVIKTDSKRAVLIKTLIEKGYTEEVWKQLIESEADLATNLSLARLQQKRIEALKLFSEHLKNPNLSETEWQKYFENNTWIFGYGLDYRFLKTVTTQPNYGGATVLGRGDNKGDFLTSTSGDIRYTVLVEIKKSSTKLLDSKPYRNDCYAPSSELAGGTSQLRVNAKQWETTASRNDKNRDIFESQNIFTVTPKQILIIGNLNQLEDRSQRESFELYRRGQNDVEIMTYDEVYERASFIVKHEEVTS